MHRSKYTVILLIFLSFQSQVMAQDKEDKKEAAHITDSLFVDEYENKKGPDKVLHAEPLYIDLIRDLGARKGEKEWNLGLGITDNIAFDEYEALIEYEFAPVNRLGFEAERPFTFYSAQQGVPQDSLPKDHLDAIKLATQWSFFVSEEIATSMALGYIHEFLTNDFENMDKDFFIGNLYNPFFIIAKRWGLNWHSLIYTGPMLSKLYGADKWQNSYEVNANIHYMVASTRNFLGVEFNMSFQENDFDMTMRPQMRLEINEQLLVGIVFGIPVERENERFSGFARLIWEPKGWF